MKRESGLRLWEKQTLIVALLSLPIVVLFYLAVREKNSEIEFARNEASGIAYLSTVRLLMEHTTQFVSTGNSNAAARVDDTLRKLESLDQELGAKLQTTSTLRALTAQWQQVRSNSANAVDYSAFLAGSHALITQVTDTSGLFIDPNRDAVYLMEIVAMELPKQQNFIAQTTRLGTHALMRKELPLADKGKLLDLTTEIQTTNKTTKANLEKAIEHNSSGAIKLLTAKFQENNAAVQVWLNLLNQKILTPATLEASTIEDVRAFTAAGNAALAASLGFWDPTAQTLAGLIKARNVSLTWNRNALLLGGLLVALLIGLVLLTLVRGVVQQLNSLTRLVAEINAGNLSARAEVLTNGELGALAKAFNEMLDANQGLVQTRAERDEMQRSIMKLLDEVSSVARGDLSREAEVAEGMTGAIADAFNYMSGQLRHIISKVQTVAREVNVSANATQHNTQQLAEEARQRGGQLVRAARAVDALAFSMRNVSETAEASKIVALETLETAKRGSTILQQTIKGVSQVHGQVQESSQRLKQLGDTSREISEVVLVIGEIAKRSSVLALHASIQAASAGEAGLGFAVVVREVEHLAARLSEAAQLISELVNQTRLNTQTAVTVMEESSRGVQEGTGLIYEAGNVLGEIEQVLTQLVGLTQSISCATEQQTKESAAVSSMMLQLSEATRQTATGISRSAITASQLAALADELNGSVAAFRLAAQRRATGPLTRPTSGGLRPISVETWGSGQYLIQN